jgi:hypothetical protein
MQSIDSLLPRIMIWAEGAPQPLVKQMLSDCATQFCNETDIVQVQLDPIDLIEGQRGYELELPRNMQLARVLKVVYGESPYVPIGQPPAFFETEPPATLIVYPVPTETKEGWAHVRISTAPVRGASQLDDLLVNKYVEAIVGGTVMRLCSMQGQQFTNAPNASMGAGWYSAGVNRAKYELRKMHTAQDQRVAPRPLATGRRP